MEAEKLERLFREAVAAIDAGDVESLEQQLAAQPVLADGGGDEPAEAAGGDRRAGEVRVSGDVGFGLGVVLLGSKHPRIAEV